MYYSKNFQYLKKNNENLANAVDQLNIEDTKLIDIIETSIPGNYSMKVRLSSNSYSYLIHSSIDPLWEAKERVKNLNLSKNYYTIVIGFGLGYYIREIRKSQVSKGHVLVVLPRLDIFKYALTFMDLSDILCDPNILFVHDSELLEEDIIKAYSGNINQLKSLMIFENPGYKHIVKGDLSRYRKLVLDMVRYVYFQLGNSSHDTLIGLRNIFNNYRYIVDSSYTDKLKSVCKNKPAIIVSSGPSLDKNIKHLKTVKGKALIISAATAMHKLMNEGIVPDIVMNIERDKEMFDVFFSKGDFPNDTIFCGDVVTDNRIFDAIEGKKLIVARQTSTAENWIGDAVSGILSFDVGSSVAHIGFGFAEEIGCDPIILVGQDLAFGEQGENHAQNTIYDEKSDQYKKDMVERWKKRNENNKIKVKGNYQQFVYTSDIWYKWLKWFEMRIKKSSSKVINATEGGAFIEGTILMQLKVALEEYCSDYLGNLNDFLDTPTNGQKKERLICLASKVDNELNNLRKLKSEFHKCLDFCRSVISSNKEYSSPEIGMIFSNVSKLRDTIHEYSWVYAFVVQALQTFNYQRDMDIITIENTERLVQWLQIQEEHFKDMDGIIDITIDLYEKGLEKILDYKNEMGA